jgi:hypothetical protein
VTPVDEYLRRQAMSAKDYVDFLGRLKREFPNDSFLLVRFGDHQPDFASSLIGALPRKSLSGQKQTSPHVRVMSALPPKADIAECDWHVRFVIRRWTKTALSSG